MNPLDDFRITGRDQYAPSPIAAGLCLIRMGICLIADHLRRLPRRWFYVTQAWLVWQWMGLRKYSDDDAVAAWGFTYYSLIIVIILIRFVWSLL